MLLPALNSAREAGRRTQCKNNLKQIAAAFLAHESAHQFLPTGGWAKFWMGDPDRGFSNKQPGGWCYNILPHIELGNLWQLSGNLDPSANSSAKTAQETIFWATPVATYNCPSRRPLATEPNLYPSNCFFLPTNIQPPRVFRADYAANMGGWGDDGGYQATNYPGSYKEADYDSSGKPRTDASWDST